MNFVRITPDIFTRELDVSETNFSPTTRRSPWSRTENWVNGILCGQYVCFIFVVTGPYPYAKQHEQRTAHTLPHKDNMARVLTICTFYIHTDTCRNPTKSFFHFKLTVMTKYHTINHTVLKNTKFHTTFTQPAVKLGSFPHPVWQLSSTGFKIFQYEVSDQHITQSRTPAKSIYIYISTLRNIKLASST
jgi:hypothetical protein